MTVGARGAVRELRMDDGLPAELCRAVITYTMPLMMHPLLRLASLFVSFFALVLSGCLVAAESDVEEAASPISGGGAGGGGAGGGGGEPIGVAQQAVAGCCCEVRVDGSPGKCRNVADPSECKYEQYTEGVCNTLPTTDGKGTCLSVSGTAGDGEQAFPLLFALALGAAVRRRRRPLVPSGGGTGAAGVTASRVHR